MGPSGSGSSLSTSSGPAASTGGRSSRESGETLAEAYFFGGSFVCHYLRDAHSVLRVHELDGAHVRDIPLPGIASLAGSEHERRRASKAARTAT